MANPFFTIGHSTRPLEAFVGLLKGADVRLVVDVRTIPRSRSNPQYNSDVLPVSLSEFRIGQADDVAGLTLFLASRAGSYVTGAVIPLDGGITGCG